MVLDVDRFPSLSQYDDHSKRPRPCVNDEIVFQPLPPDNWRFVCAMSERLSEDSKAPNVILNLHLRKVTVRMRSLRKLLLTWSQRASPDFDELRGASVW